MLLCNFLIKCTLLLVLLILLYVDLRISHSDKFTQLLTFFYFLIVLQIVTYNFLVLNMSMIITEAVRLACSACIHVLQFDIDHSLAVGVSCIYFAFLLVMWMFALFRCVLFVRSKLFLNCYYPYEGEWRKIVELVLKHYGLLIILEYRTCRFFFLEWASRFPSREHNVLPMVSCFIGFLLKW